MPASSCVISTQRLEIDSLLVRATPLIGGAKRRSAGAQRRPGPQSRRHRILACAGHGRHAGPLNEGRDRNPGDTRVACHGKPTGTIERSTKAGTVIPATLRHLPKPVSEGGARSTKAGTVIPATPRKSGQASRCRWCTLNEGRDRNPGDTTTRPPDHTTPMARSTKAGTVIPATRRCVGVGGDDHLPRSTKAGTVIPATPAASVGRRGARPLNEGRDRNPGDTAEFVELFGNGICLAQRRPGP